MEESSSWGIEQQADASINYRINRVPYYIRTVNPQAYTPIYGYFNRPFSPLRGKFRNHGNA